MQRFSFKDFEETSLTANGGFQTGSDLVLRSRRIYVIDRDPVRRAKIASELALLRARQSRVSGGEKVYSVTCESVVDFSSRALNPGLLLIHDDATLFNDLQSYMQISGRRLVFIIFSENPTPQQMAQARKRGAVDYFNWPFDMGKLVKTALSVSVPADGGGTDVLPDLYSTEKSANTGIDEELSTPELLVQRLTNREREVLVCIADGMTNVQIGGQLGISTRTVECHRANMLTKLGVRKSAAAVSIAARAGLL